MNRYKYIISLLLIVHLAVLFLFVFLRLADADEGFYMNAARMVHQGMSVYTDFFFPQMIMLPVVFAPFSNGGWESFFLLRGFAALAGFLSAILLALIVFKTTRGYKTTTIALAMYVFSGITIVWHSAFKTLPFCSFLSLGTFFFWLLYYEKRRLSYMILTGLFLSALINFRSVFIVLLPPYFLSMFSLSKAGRLKNLAIFIVSLIPFALPTLLTIIQAPDRFFYGNLILRLNRIAEGGFGAVFSNKATTVFRAIIDPHLLIIFALAVISFILLIKQKRLESIADLFRKPKGMAILNLFLIGAVYLLPYPIARQYIEQFLAFGIILAAFNIGQFLTVMNRALTAKVRKAVFAAVSALFLLSIVPYVAIFIFGVRDNDRMYMLSNIGEITDRMLALSGPSDTVLSEWPGYPFLTGQIPLRYTEIETGENRSSLNHDGYLHYNLADRQYFNEELRKKTPRLVVILYKPPAYYASSLENNYDGVFSSNDVTIYKRK